MSSGTIIFLDMGMMGTLTQQKRMAIVDLLWSLSSGDKREIAKTVLRLSTSYKEVDEASFIEEVERLLTLLDRVNRVANTGHWRDGALLSIATHPVFEDVRAALDAAKEKR